MAIFLLGAPVCIIFVIFVLVMGAVSDHDDKRK